MSQNNLPETLPTVQKLITRISVADRSQQKEIRISIQEARDQGDPTDVRVIKDLAHANRKIWSTGASVTESGIVLGK